MRLDAYGRERREGDVGYGACDHYDPHAEAMRDPRYAEIQRRWQERHGVKNGKEVIGEQSGNTGMD